MSEPEVTTQGGKRLGAGRPIGAKDIRKQVRDICNELGLNPTEKIVEIVLDSATPLDIRARLLQDLQQYIAPKLKSVEIRGSLDDDRPIQLVLYKDVKKEDLDSPI